MELKAHPIPRRVLPVAILALGILSVPFAQPAAQAVTYGIGWHAISNSARVSRNGCFAVAGTVGQPALQPSMGSTYAIVPGYLTATSTATRDTIFYNGFERCTP